ncbi:MAG: hypothetical protein ACYS0I_00210 [Planctomycetota bacterium]|jgi:hypothetical protein
MTNKVLILTVCITVLSGFCGCQNAGGGGRGAEVKVEEEEHFPKFLVGTWKTDDGKWELTFDYDGSITSMRHYFVSIPIDVAEGGVYEPLGGDFYGFYILGPCQADYNPDTRELNVRIIIDYFRLEVPAGVSEGTMTDRFDGPISENGRRWNVSWVNHVQFVDVDYLDPNAIPPKSLTFTKVD